MFQFFINIIIASLVAACGYPVVMAGRTNFKIRAYQVCTKQSPVIFTGNLTNENGKQYINYDVKLPFPIDDNIGSTWFIEQSFNAKTFLPIFTIKEKYACKAANKYLGEYWYQFQRVSQMQPRVCPVAAGRYRLHHYLLDFSNLALQTFPFGTLRFTLNAIDNTKNESIFCLKAILDNLDE